MIQDHLDQHCWDEGWTYRKKRNKKYTSRCKDEDTDRYTYKSVKTGYNLTLAQTEGYVLLFWKETSNIIHLSTQGQAKDWLAYQHGSATTSDKYNRCRLCNNWTNAIPIMNHRPQ